MEREAIKFRLDSGLKRYREQGGKVGRKVGSIKTKEKKQEEYAKVLRCLKQGKSIRDTSVLCGVSVSTVFRVKREFGVWKGRFLDRPKTPKMFIHNRVLLNCVYYTPPHWIWLDNS